MLGVLAPTELSGPCSSCGCEHFVEFSGKSLYYLSTYKRVLVDLMLGGLSCYGLESIALGSRNTIVAQY